MCRHIAVVHLVDNNLRGVHCGALILAPALGVGVTHVDDSTAITIYIECAREDTGSLLEYITIHRDLKGVVHTLFVTLNLSTPKTHITPLHSHNLGEFVTII